MKKLSQKTIQPLFERSSSRRRPTSRRRDAGFLRLGVFSILSILPILSLLAPFDRPTTSTARGNEPSESIASSNDSAFYLDPNFSDNNASIGNLDASFSGNVDVAPAAASPNQTADDLTALTLGISPETRELGERLGEQYETKSIGNSTFYTPTAPVSNAPIAVSADFGWKGVDDEFGEVYVLYGNCRVSQGNDVVSAPAAVIWKAANPTRVAVYLEKDASQPEKPLQLDLGSNFVEAKSNGSSWFGTFKTGGEIDLRIATPGETQLKPEEIYFRAQETARRETSGTAATSADGSLPPAPQDKNSTPGADFAANDADRPLSAPAPVSVPQNSADVENADGALGWNLTGDGNEIVQIPQTAGIDQYFSKTKVGSAPPFRRIQILRRYDGDMEIKRRASSSESTDGDGKDVWLVSNGFTIVFQGIDAQNLPIGDVVEISADQATIWAPELDSLRFGDKTVANDRDFEMYLAGNVVFREGDNVIYAEKMYYDVKNSVGIIQDAELIARVPDVQNGFIRLSADKIAQRGPDALYASNAWISTSAMGEPTYRLQTDSIVAERRETPLFDAATGRPTIDPQTGKQQTKEEQYFIAENNFVSLGSVPVFYWPWMAMDVKDRSMYLRNLKFGSDSVFGTQVRSTWNPYQLFGISERRPAGTEWDLNLDYLSKRGFGHGTTFVYNRDSIGCWNTRAVGMANYYGISDKGVDNLGYGRRSVPFPDSYRYRAIWKHRQELGSLGFLGDGWLLTGQLGKSSDRNFIPQYFEDEWKTSSNPATSLELKKTVNNWSLSASAAVQTDTFYTQTNRLPRLDHYWLGQSLGPLVWYEHTQLGYEQFRTTDVPYATEDKDLFRYLNWELADDATSNSPYSTGTKTLSTNSFVFSTRHELDAPFQLGPIKTTPYALGEYGFWSQGVSQKNISRLYGRLGVRLNLPIWKVDSDVESKTWYLHGLAHKMNFVVDASYSDANQNYDSLVLYDQIDDWQVEDFRRRYSVTTFGGSGANGFSDSIPVRFDERYYAIRQGEIGGNVTSPSAELADDLQLVRLGWNNRWQTKRGPAGNRRVVDWITLNGGINLYPNESENFGKVPGLLDYDANWQVGDRFSVLSSGLYDVWGSGQKITRFGLMTKRPGLSSVYLGLDRLAGPIDSTYLNLAIMYRASEKWGLGFSNSVDLSQGYDVGQKLTISRIGESFVFTLGANRNESQNNWGVNLSVEPVFLFDKGKREEGLLGLGSM